MSAARTLSAVRIAVAARIAELNTPAAPWWEAPIPFDRFGVTAVPDHIPDPKAHLAFAAGLPSTPEFEDRQKVTDGAFARSELRVRFLARAKPPASGAKTAEDAALDHEHDLIKHLMQRSATWPGDREITLLLTRRSQACPPPHDWFLHEVQFRALHRLALT